MDFVSGPVPLGEWMPDSPDLQFPNLLEAKNIEPIGTVYKSFAPLVDTGGGAVPGGFLRGFHQAVYQGVPYIYAGTDAGIFENPGGSGSFTARSATMTPAQYDFVQYKNLEIVAPSALVPMYRTLGSTSNFATLGSSSGTAPTASRVGKIGQFVFLGNTSDGEYAVRWAGIDNPLSWPTPNSSTAIAQQSGIQYLDANLGEVTGFSNGDQHGLIFQKSGITRVTYAGPPVVFQFDKITDKVGCPYPRSIVQVGPLTYFVSQTGFYKTDGVSVENIGYNKCNGFFKTASQLGAYERVYGAVNIYRNLIYWTYCNTSDPESGPTDLIIYNYVENRFSRASQACEGILSTNGIESAAITEIRGFGSANTLGTFSGLTSGSQAAVFETGDIEFNPGGRAFLTGAKLLVDQTANAIVAYSEIRDELMANQVTTSAASTANSQTGFSDFRRDARYHRLLFNVSGIFEQAQSMEFKAKASGSR